MSEEFEQNQQTDDPIRDENPYEAYGWEFHKKPLMYAAIVTVLFYAFVFFYVSI